jgi:hypothetical protein
MDYFQWAERQTDRKGRPMTYWGGLEYVNHDALATTIRSQISDAKRAEFARAMAGAEGIDVVEHATPE